MTTVAKLVEIAKNEFAFLEEEGFVLIDEVEFSPESFKGGFDLIFQDSTGNRVSISYSDWEFEVSVNGKEVFGVTQFEPFAGNMFSREHLLENLRQIRHVVEPPLRALTGR